MAAEAVLRLAPPPSREPRLASRTLHASGRRPIPAAPLALLEPNESVRVAEAFRYRQPTPTDLEPGLRGVLRDLLDHPGSLARAQLAYALMRELGAAAEPALSVAAAIEYFHTASLVFDDLPSMDDATERRGRPCPHVAHGEGPAVLGALALINRAYGLLWRVLADLDRERSRRAAILVEECLGATGVLDGQARDLAFEPSRAGADEVLRVAMGKTVPLVRLSLVLPALVAGAADAELERLEELAIAWGLAYQVLDDFKDLVTGREETGKSPERDLALGRPNLPATIGMRPAMARLTGLLASAGRVLSHLELRAPAWHSLRPLQDFLQDERRRLVLRLADGRSRGA